MLRSLECLSYKECLRELRPFSLERRNIKGDFITLYNCLKGDFSQVGGSLFSQAAMNSRRGHSLKLLQGRFRLDIRRYLFTQRVIDIGMDMVESLPLEMVEERTVALSDTVWLTRWCLVISQTG